MTPFFFGTQTRRLLGLYTPASADARGQRAVVLCYPWGQEYLRAHRSMRHLATLLSRAGVHVLRFDYFGTGDSAGEMTDADLKGWQKDIGEAVTELKDTSGVGRVGLIGLRLGATLAARAAAERRSDVDRLVMWDPVVDGGEYLREIRQQSAELCPPVQGEPPNTEEEILGFELTERLAREIGAIDLPASTAGLPARSLIVVSQPLASHERLRAAAPNVPMETVASPPAWLEDKGTGVGAIPVTLLQQIVKWFE